MYEFQITNTGTTRLTDVGVDDPMLAGAGVAVSCPRDTLRPDQSMVCESGAYTITGADVDAGGVLNVATATATPPGGGKLTSDESTALVSTNRDNGDLPDTGAGFTWWMPLAGLGLLAIGFGLILAKPGRGRRRKV